MGRRGATRHPERYLRETPRDVNGDGSRSDSVVVARRVSARGRGLVAAREHPGSAALGRAWAQHRLRAGTRAAAADRWCPVTLGRRSNAQLVMRDAAGDDRGDAASLLQKVQMPLHVREAREQSRPLWLP